MNYRKYFYILIGFAIGVFFIWFVYFVHEVFIGARDVSPYLVHIGNFGIKWYSFFIAVSFVIGLIFAHRDVKKYGLSVDDFDKIIFWSSIAAFVGARMYHVFSSWDYYRYHPGEIIKTWHGGLGIYGGVIGGLLVGYILCRVYKMPFLLLADIVSPWLIFGQALGRWGNFFNHEAYGVPTNLPWKMYIPPQYRFEKYAHYAYYHPTFLYESLWDFFVFFLLLKFKSSRRKKDGDIFFGYLGLYSFGRFWVEFLRFDTWKLYGVKMAHVIASALMILSLIWFLYLRNHSPYTHSKYYQEGN